MARVNLKLQKKKSANFKRDQLKLCNPKNRGKGQDKKQQSIREMLYTFNQNNIHILGIPEGGELKGVEKK